VNLGTPITVSAGRDGSKGSWIQVYRGLNDLIILGRETGAGVAGLFTGGDFFLILLAAGAVFLNLEQGTTTALSRGLAVLAAGGAGAFLASRDLAVALTGRALARAGVAARSLEALYDTAEAPLGDLTPIPIPGGPLKFLRDGGVAPAQWQDTVQSCRRLRYNMQSSPWILLAWNSVGIALAASGALLPGMAAGFALLGSVFLTHRALKLSKTS
jgi:cation transport ATPase